MLTKTCRNCGKEFVPYVHTQLFCSSKCGDAFRYRESKRKTTVPTKLQQEPKKETKICLNCGREFETHRATQKYCSGKCGEAFRSRNAPKKPKKELSPKKCAYCGKEFIPNEHSQIYCSSKCRQRRMNHNKALRTKSFSAKAKSLLMRNPTKPKKSSTEWEREAAECNMDYGTYRTMIECCGKTFEELFATKDSRTPIQAHANHGNIGEVAIAVNMW